MAEKRMISKCISVSEKVNLLPDLFDMLLFTWIIPHTDDFGRMPGNPAKVKALVVPMLDKTIRDVEQSLLRLNDAKLIEWYESSGDKVIQVINFEKHQSGLHKRTKSKFPEPPSIGQAIPGNSRNVPEIPLEGKGTEENRREGKGDSPPDLLKGNPHEQRIMKLINDCELEDLDFFPIEQICSYIGVVDIEVIEVAVRKASKKHINYALRTLEGMIRDGKTTKESVTYLQAVPDQKQKKADPVLEDRKIEIARNKFIESGGDPGEFKYNAATGA